MKSSNKKIALASALAVCSCFCLAACNKKSKTFDAPENVRVAVDTLSWDEVTGATNGYTVKINSDETTTVSDTSLDLTTVTAKLIDGDNKLSVRVNATDKIAASAYSTEVTYTFNQPTSGPFAKPTVTLSGDTLSWRAVDGATNGYTVKSDLGTITVATASVNLKTDAKSILKVGDNSLAVKVNAAGDRAESAYSDNVSYNYVVTPEEEAEGFVEVVEAIGTVTADSQSKIDTAKAKYNNLTDGAKAVSATATALATLKEKDCAFYGLLVNAIGTVSKNSTLANLEAAKSAIDAADAYYATLLDNTGAASAHTTFGQKKDAYDTAIIEIETEVDGIAEDVEQLLANTPTAQTKAALKPYYDSLAENKQSIDGLTEYGAKYWTDNYNSTLYSSLTAKINQVLAIHVDNAKEDKKSAPFINYEFTKTTEIYITRKYLNILDKGVSVSNPATATLTIDGQEQTGVAGAFDETSGCYVYKISFKWPVTDETTDPVTYAESVDVSYQLSDGEKVDITIKNPSGIVYSSNDTSKFMSDDGKFTYYGASGAGSVYADVYAATDIVAEGRNNDISVTGAPLTTIEITPNMTMDDFKFPLARADILGENLDLRFVVYEKTAAGVYSRINSSSVSEVLTFDVAEIDKYYSLPTTGMDFGVWDAINNYKFSLIVDGNIGNLYTFINEKLAYENITGINVTAANAKNYIGIKLEAEGTISGTTNKLTFTKNLALESGGYGYPQMVADWSKEYYTANKQGPQNTSLTNVKIYISYYIKDEAPSGLKTYFPQATRGLIHDGNEDRNEHISVATLDKSAIMLPNTGMRLSGAAIEFLRDSVGNGKILLDGDAECLEIKFFKTGNESTAQYAYLYNVNGKAYILKNKSDYDALVAGGDDAEVVKQKLDADSNTNNAYIDFGVFKTFVLNNYKSSDGFGLRLDDGWTLTSRYILSDKVGNEYLLDGAYSTAIVCHTDPIALTKAPLLSHNDGDQVFAFFEAIAGTSIGRGDIFALGAVDKVELHFYEKGETDGGKCIYAKYNTATKAVDFYYNNGGTETKLDFEDGNGELRVENVWIRDAWIANAIKTVTGIDGSQETTWRFYTVSHLRNGSVVFNNGDQNGNVKSTEFDFDFVIPADAD